MSKKASLENSTQGEDGFDVPDWEKQKTKPYSEWFQSHMLKKMIKFTWASQYQEGDHYSQSSTLTAPLLTARKMSVSLRGKKHKTKRQVWNLAFLLMSLILVWFATVHLKIVASSVATQDILWNVSHVQRTFKKYARWVTSRDLLYKIVYIYVYTYTYIVNNIVLCS